MFEARLFRPDIFVRRDRLAAGTDPLDPESFPPFVVAALGALGLAPIALLLLGAGYAALPRRFRIG